VTALDSAQATRASSSALIGFGLGSVIEVASALAVAWQFAGRDPEAREKVALKVIAVSFFALAAFVSVDAVRSLVGEGEAEHSSIGLALAAVSLAVMPFLSYAQRRAGRELGSASAVAGSQQSLLCTYLSGVLLVGLALNSLFGWSWADPIAALVIAGVAVKEGQEAWRGDDCCTSGAMSTLISRTLAVAAATAFTALFIVLGGAPAAAHTDLQSSAPADGEALTTAPDTVTLTFATAVASQFAQVTVTGPDGRSVTTGETTVEGAVVRQPVSPNGDGAYVVAYRVVSDDGHPVSGELGFTLTGSGAAPAPTQAEGPTEASAPVPSTPAPATASPAADSDTSEGDGWGLWLLLIGVVAVFVVGTVLALRRRGDDGG
jgi:methionine-rich copper-binding protein CopC